MKRVCKLISDYMGVLVLLSAVLALLAPGTFSGIKPSVINPLLCLVMFGMGMALRFDDFRIVFSRPRDIAIGCLAQYTVMPLLAWVLSRLFALDDALTVGVILVGCCPGGTASNVITYLAKGDLALSVGMTATSTVLAPFVTPLLVWLLVGQTVDVEVVGMLLSIFWVVILPIVAGLFAKWLWPKFTERATVYLPALSSLAICAIVLIVISANASKLLAGGLIIILVVVLHNLCGLSIGYLIGRMLRLPAAKRKAISIEVGMQNAGLATVLAGTFFAAQQPLTVLPCAISCAWHSISGTILAGLFLRHSPSQSSKCETT
jgi:BASS family bile acid:Na+ symporter